MVRIGTRIPEEVDMAKTPTAVAVAIAVMISETGWSQNILSKEKWKTFQSPN